MSSEEEDNFEDAIDQAPPGEEEAEEYYQPVTSEDIIAEHEKQEAKEEPPIVLPGLTPGVVPGGVTEAVLGEVLEGMDLFFNNKFEQCKSLFEKKAERSMYHSLGYGTVLAVRAIMTLERGDIQQAMSQLKLTLALAEYGFSKKTMTQKIQSFWKSSSDTNSHSARSEHVHAELVHAEATLIRASLMFLSEEGLIGFIKGGLSIKNSYSTYKHCLKIFEKLDEKDKEDPLCRDFMSGVLLGVGSFNLILSLMPSRVLKLFEIIGFTSDKEKGIQMLDEGGKIENSTRAPLCDLVTLFYNAVLGGTFELPDCDLDKAQAVLEKNLVKYPSGAIYLYFDGKIAQGKKLIRASIESLQKSVESELDWSQLHHICFWELCWCHSLLLEWEMAAGFAQKLYEQSKWSKSFYAYQQAAFLLETGDQKYKEQIKTLMETVPKNKQKIAGKSIPIEKLVIRKVRQYFDQGESLFLPGFEITYLWGYFRLIGESVDRSLEIVKNSINEAENRTEDNSQKSKFLNRFDDICLGLIIQGCLLRQEGDTLGSEESFLKIVSMEGNIRLDHYLVPFARMELGRLYINMDRLEEAKHQLETAKSKYRQYSMESRLHFRVHLLQTEIQSKSKKNGS